MARTAIIRATTGIVGNVVDVTAWTPPPGWLVVPTATGQIGQFYNGSTFADVVPTVEAPDDPVGGVRLDTDVSTTLATFQDTGLGVPGLRPGTLHAFEFWVVFSSSTTTTGIALAVAGPASPALVVGQTQIPTSLTAITQGAFGAYDAGTPTGSIDTINAARLARVWGLVRTGAAGGGLRLRFRSEVATTAVTVRADSWGRVTVVGG